MKIAEMTRGELAERLILSVLNTEECKDRLLNFPHIEKGSFSLVVQLCLGEKNLEGKYTSCITVTNDIWSGWNSTLSLSRDDMFSLAVENSNRLFPILIEPVDNLFGSAEESKDVSFKSDGINLPYCLVLTNQDFFNGAAAMFYKPEALGKMAQELGTTDIYLLPSSTNHIFCVPKTDILSKDEINTVFSEMTNALSDDEHSLSDSVLTYNKDTDMIVENSGITYSPKLDFTANIHQGMDNLSRGSRR